jgi:glycosyltransferase involved in cell wall biosynthesis
MRIAFVVNNAAFFVSHRLSIARQALADGHQIMLLTGRAGSASLEPAALAKIRALGIPHQVAAFKSTGMNPLVEVIGLIQLTMQLRRFRPEVVHCVSPKGILYGGLAARWTHAPSLVLAVSGMGFLFTGAARGLRGWIGHLYAITARKVYAHRNKRVIVQNRDDWLGLQQQGLARADELVLIPGSGVPLARFASVGEVERQNLVVLPARILGDKGVVEFVEAARRLRAAGCRWRFALVGTADYQNPTAISASVVEGWVGEGCIEWWGHREDMEVVLAQARIVCLPSYREGMPKCLLEAAAAGCAIVTTDVVGCREAIETGVTGDLVPPQDAQALADCLAALIADPDRLHRYGQAGRTRAIERFDEEAVIARTLEIYEELNHGTTR